MSIWLSSYVAMQERQLLIVAPAPAPDDDDDNLDCVQPQDFVTEKVLACVVIFLFGLLPGLTLALVLRRQLKQQQQHQPQQQQQEPHEQQQRQQQPQHGLLLSLLNCFSAGVFLGVGIMHLLPEAWESWQAINDDNDDVKPLAK